MVEPGTVTAFNLESVQDQYMILETINIGNSQTVYIED